MFLVLISVCAVLVTFIKLYFLMKSVSTIIFGITNQKALAGPSAGWGLWGVTPLQQIRCPQNDYPVGKW